MSRVLVTGGAGYIGSHTCIELMAAGHQVVVVDNLCNSKRESLTRVERIAGQGLQAFVQADVRDRAAMRAVFAAHDIDAVIHFAGLKAVGESVAKPLEYYDNNVSGTVALCEVMAEAGVKTLAFSSSATVYGDPASVPIREDFPTGPTNPYGRSKWMVEYLLQDLVVADPSWRIALLRYFNPVGAHESGLIGEDPNGLPNNLMPFVSQVAVGKLAELRVFGGDWPTPDGTGVRDYIHVLDLAQGHVRAIDYLAEHAGLLTVNLGTGRGYSVLEVVRAFEQASGRAVPYRIVDRRPGDIAQCYADPAHANRLLGWVARRDLAQMCADAWNWQRSNPQGYA
ncbi:MAG: UDP-glucose 4-epimerase GalE [Methyloversatilis sp.]|jgi:UDP-glucose 4-epimerase|uniref:UDP-glucose 4-epimerase GalE n=1 Tax=Methyloversatilis TaxID=378210 RepID=UPI000DB37077|nr:MULTISPECIES: UDP-glucose 4-epimerase GalE [Methyloversatilis]MBV5284576.1 UDP-glucose 4-epimerase GalE [Methyloversatilis discipulorum]MCR6666847.1 UDP-glucose 4-epimerase GalE [Methyloversatilis sp.]PZU53686.1 MAG: UDP-glucose 4-epimerase GalE [Thauera sp.]